MDARTWAIVVIAVLVIFVAGYYILRPADDGPTGTAPPATTEQPVQPAPTN